MSLHREAEADELKALCRITLSVPPAGDVSINAITNTIYLRSKCHDDFLAMIPIITEYIYRLGTRPCHSRTPYLRPQW